MYQVKNCPNWVHNHKYTVIRDCRNEQAPNNGYWFYGSYNSLLMAQEALNEINNGLIVESEEVEMVPPYNNFG